jgi:mediator of RNA polymerase II transcription subunit 12
MVTELVHPTQVTESGERVEDSRRQNVNLIKKLKKELTDRNSDSMKPLRQLLPLPFSKVQAEIIVTQPTSTIIDSKGNRVQSFEFVDKKPVSGRVQIIYFVLAFPNHTLLLSTCRGFKFGRNSV